MKRCLALLAIISAPFAHAIAQDKKTDATANVAKSSRDYVMIQLTYENWSKTPDSVKLKGLNRGFNAYVCYDFPIKKSNFSFAAGIGIGTTNIYFDDQQANFTDTGALGQQVTFSRESRDYKKFKLSTAYMEAPFELRYFGNKINRNKGFKAALGLRVGTLVGAHTKGKFTTDGAKMSEKVNTRRYMENWRFAGTFRIGYGNFSLLGTYNLNTLFKEGQGPAVVPYSVGICISGL